MTKNAEMLSLPMNILIAHAKSLADALTMKVAMVMKTGTSLHQRKRKQLSLLKFAENPRIQMTKSGVNASAISSVDALIWPLKNEDNTTPVQSVTDVIRLTNLYNWPMG